MVYRWSFFRSMSNLCTLQRLLRFLNTPAGNTGIEYGLIAAGIAIAILAVVFTLGNVLENFFSLLSDHLVSAEAKR